MRKMKDSGIEWIGEIPANWKVMPHKYIMHKQKDICEHYNGEDIISLTMGGVIVRDLTAGGKMPTTFDGYQYVEPEDLLMCLFDIDVTPRCVGVVHNYGLTSPAYSRFKVHNGYYNAYYDYLLRFIDDEKVFIHLSKNLRSSLTETDFGTIKTVVPSYEEQKRIADFLDRKCAEIDTVIDKTKATIEEYKKLKQSVITEAVTKGIRGDRAMKDSGIEWIGEIPAEWDFLFLKYVTDFQEGPGIMGNDFCNEGIPLIRISGMKGNFVSKEGCNYLDPEMVSKKWEHFKLNQGDVVISASASMGIAALVDSAAEGCIPYTGLIRFPTNDKVDKMFLRYYLISNEYMEQINVQKTGTAIQHYGPTHIEKVKIALPPLNEQLEISKYLEIKCSEIDNLIVMKTTLLEEMESYKKSVIYEYVTGKKEIFV